MTTQRVAKRTAFYNADRSKLVAEDSPEASALFVREGTAVQDAAEAERLGYTDFEEAQVYDAAADHLVKHGHETAAEAERARQRMFAGQPDPDGPPVEGERDEKSLADAKGTKAVAKAPANKAG